MWKCSGKLYGNDAKSQSILKLYVHEDTPVIRIGRIYVSQQIYALVQYNILEKSAIENYALEVCI